MILYYFLLVVSIVLAVFKTSIYNSYANKSEPAIGAIFRFNAISYGVAAIVAFIGMWISAQTISWATVICAFFYAIIVMSLQTISITAMRLGTMSKTSICVMYGMVIPAVAGPIFWEETIGFLQVAGIIMMVVSLWLINGKQLTEKKETTKTWTILAILAFILSGMAGVMEKIHQSTEAAEERLPFIFVACSLMFVFSTAAKLITRKKDVKLSRSRSIFLPLLSGIVIGLYSTVNLILSGNLDSMIYYPIANGGAMLLTILVSAIVFKEHFNLLRRMGIIIGLFGILCLSMPI